jgi:hypothetical protein
VLPSDKPDIFISHASEDKDAIARPLAVALRERGFSVWFDEYVLKLGDNLRDVIDRGLRHARFGVVILSPAFFAKEWPRRELDALWARETKHGDKVILPVLHDMSYLDVVGYSPLIAGKLAVSSSRGIDFVASQITDAIQAATSATNVPSKWFTPAATADVSVSTQRSPAMLGTRAGRRYGAAFAIAMAIVAILWWNVQYLTRRAAVAAKQEIEPLVNVKITPTMIGPGDTAELQWSTQHATSVFIMPDIGFVPLQGSRRVSKPTTYIVAATTPQGLPTIRAVKLGRVGQTADDVKLLVPAVEMGTMHFKLKPTRLDWSSVDATQVAIVPTIGFVPGAGIMEIFPQSTTKFTIIGTNPSGEYAVGSAVAQVLRWPGSENSATSAAPNTRTRPH